MSDPQSDPWRARFERERSARREAESLLHDKSRALFLANQALEARASELTASLEQLRRAQDQLVEQEKMAALGGLVAGVAHEINTPIGIAVTAITHAADRLRLLEASVASSGLTRGTLRTFMAEMNDAVELALQNLQRGAQLVQSFKKVAIDQSSGDMRDAVLEQMAADVIASLRSVTRRANAQVSLVGSSSTPVVIDASSFIQILTNLIQNACVHAFEGAAAPHEISVLIDVQPDAAVLVIEDNGVGMSADTAARVFEPFFTTRRGAGGSGLGMHIVHTLVTQRFRGTIALQTAPGAGAKWSIRLPFDSAALTRA